ncbi:hypothetical protein CIPAW_15G147700 [Carya illinoinensis]|uniref:Uncharacterized protein n=1 Tax=Carya illinoinensis TaxID=32201 RepID=A0A8T1ND28_CARIL|nr:hypothetical protein CIPAW_15G147700 [Carya illinoinensis]
MIHRTWPLHEMCMNLEPNTQERIVKSWGQDSPSNLPISESSFDMDDGITKPSPRPFQILDQLKSLSWSRKRIVKSHVSVHDASSSLALENIFWCINHTQGFKLFPKVYGLNKHPKSSRRTGFLWNSQNKEQL